MYEEDVLTECQCQKWFAKIRSGNCDVQDASHSGSSIEANERKIKVSIETNR